MSEHSAAQLTPQQQHAGFWSLFWLWAAGNVLLTNFVTGSSYAGIGFWPMTVITCGAFLCGLTLTSWNSQRSARYGIDEIVSLRPAFGYHGSIYGAIVLVGINLGWVGILASMAGTAMVNLLSIGGIAFPGDYVVCALGSGIVVPLIVVMFSQKAAFVLSKIAVPVLLVFVAYIVWRLVVDGHLAAVVDKPADGETTWAGAFEVIFAFNMSWFPYLGSWNRFARSERASFWGTFLGLASTGILFAVIGGTATLATGEIDPAHWSADLGLGVPAFVVILLGTVASVTHLLGAGSVGILSLTPKLNYRWVCVAVTVPSILFVFASSLQDMFNILLLLVGMLVGPYWAVAMTDFFFVRWQRISVPDTVDPNGRYRYTGGFNLVAFGCVLVGIVVWLFLGGWMLDTSVLDFSAGVRLFEFAGATLPSMAVTAVLYLVVSQARAKPHPVYETGAPSPDHAPAADNA